MAISKENFERMFTAKHFVAVFEVRNIFEEFFRFLRNKIEKLKTHSY